MSNERIHLSTTEVLAISAEVDRLSADLEELSPEIPSHAARISAIMDDLYRYDHAVSTSLAAPSRAHLRLVS